MKGLIFTYVLTYGGAAASLFNPYVGLLAFVCFGIMRPPSMWPWSVPLSNYSETLAIALLVGWALQGTGQWAPGRAKGPVLALLAFWGWDALSALAAPEQTFAWHSVEAISKIVLPMLVGFTLLNSAQRLRQLLWVIVLSQGYVAFEMNLSYLQGYNRLYFDGFATLDNNTFALTMVVATGLSFFLGLHGRNWMERGVAFAAAALNAHAVFFSFSRGAMLGLAVSGLAGFIMLPKSPKHYMAFAVATLICLRLAGPQVVDRFMSSFAEQEERDASAGSRIALWTHCLDVMSKNPVLGAGPEHWKLIAHTYGWPRGKAAHSLWMQMGAELGVPGLTFLLLFYLLSMWHLWQLVRPGAPPLPFEMEGAARAVVCALCGFMVSAQFVSVHEVELPYYVALAGLGVLKLQGLPQPCALQQPAVELLPSAQERPLWA